MKLQILIPHYKESQHMVKNLLDSIAIQQNIDLRNQVGVIIASDGGGVELDRPFLNAYQFPVEYYVNSHIGIAATRNFLLAHATADYIAFCDADDAFCSAIAFASIFNIIDNQDGFDELVCYHYSEELSYGKIIYRENTRVVHPFIHGKVFNRKYLVDNQIGFSEEVQYHEDVYFSFLAHSCAGEVKLLPQFAYIWKYNPNSVTRGEVAFTLHKYLDSLKIIGIVSEELMRRGKTPSASYYFICCICNTYFFMHSKEWIPLKETEDYAKVAQATKELYAKLGKELFETADEIFIHDLFEDTKQTNLAEGGVAEEDIQESLEDWLRRILNE